MNTAKILAEWRERSPEQWIAGANRYLPPGVTLLLVIAIAYELSKLTWLVMPGASTGELPVAGASLLGGKRVTLPSSDYDTLLGSHLFGDPPTTTPEPAPEAIVDAPDTTLNLSLTGIKFGEGVPSAAIISSNRGPDKTYNIGQAIDNANGATLHSVYSDRIILNRGDHLETLRLPKVPEASSTAARIPTGPRAAPSPAQNDSLRQVITQNASRLTDILRVAPQVEQGQVVGFRVNPGRDRDTFEALGLQAGDVVTDINGTTLNDPGKGLQVFEQLGEATQANVTVLRDGVPQVLVVDTTKLQSLKENRE